MRPISLPWLGLTAIFAIAFGWVVTLSFYGIFPGIRIRSSVGLWVLALICGIAGWVVRRRVAAGRIGQDRRQMSPLSVALWLVVGQASAWGGATFFGLYAGISLYVVPQSGFLAAASSDVPGLIACVLGSAFLALAGLWLERSCIDPPQNSQTFSGEVTGNT